MVNIFCQMDKRNKQMGLRGRVVHAQAREVIANVLKFMKAEAEHAARSSTSINVPLIPLSNYKQRVLIATGISEKLYRTIKRESEAIECGISDGFKTPTPQKKMRLENNVVLCELKAESEGEGEEALENSTAVIKCELKEENIDDL